LTEIIKVVYYILEFLFVGSKRKKRTHAKIPQNKKEKTHTFTHVVNTVIKCDE